MTVPIEPGWLSLLPPVAAIVLALIFKEVVLSLFAGIWIGALLLTGYEPVSATLMTIERFAVDALADRDHVSIVVFSMMLGGTVGVLNRSGGTRGIVESLSGLATSARRGQFMTWLAGFAIFFDDYANTLIVGNTMRPITDRLKVSREKLAYIVDSTAAPMAVTALISTWVGFEITLIGDALRTAASQTTDAALQAELLAASQNPFAIFLHSIPYLFYPILTLAFVAMTVVMKREFGPMLAAERRAASGGGLIRPGSMPAVDTSAGVNEPPDGAPLRWYNAVVPVLSVIVVALVGIYVSGAQSLGAGDHSVREIVGAADPFKSLLWASLTGCLVAILLPVAQRILTVTEAIEAWVGGVRSMVLAIVILVLAWSLGAVTEALGTGPYLSTVLQDTIPLPALPVLVFLVAALISFATGTSWGTMAILFPVVVPLAVSMGAGVGFDGSGNYSILLGVISSIMAGSIFGDHCSPISDTTVMSSMASACDHIDHVRTQLPYAIVVGLVAMIVGDIPTALGFPPVLSILVGLGILYAILRFVGKSVDVPAANAEPAPTVAVPAGE